jgi:glycine hydroxymethyltransferase
MAEVLDGLTRHGDAGNAEVEAAVRRKVAQLCARFPVYP